MTSKVEIANLALDEVAARPIVSFEDGTTSSNAIALHYAQAVDEVLESNNWTSAIKRQELAQLSEAPVNGFAYAYTLPTNPYCLKVVSAELSFVGQNFKKEGHTIVTDSANATIKYIARLSDSESFGPHVTRCVIALLALKICYAVTGSNTRIADLRDNYDDVWADASANDGMQGSPDEIRANDLLDCR